MKTRFMLWIWVFLLVLTILGCTGTSNSPINLQEKPVQLPLLDKMPVGISDYDSNGNPAAGMGSLGLFQMRLDPLNVTAELSSLRQGALTDVLETVDITNFLSMAPCHDCVKIKSVALDNDGNLVVSVGIKHPFNAGDPMKPISGQNRADLHVFNVEGIVISNTSPISFPDLQASVADFGLLNADGYTGYLDGVIDTFYPTDATIHPYITHFDDYSAGNFDPSNPTGFASVTNPDPSGNLVMPMGCDYNFQDYVFDLNGPVDFIYTVGCTYAVSSASKNQRFTPEYRCPQHNKKAASEVDFVIITNNLAGEKIASTAEVEVRVVDINHGVAVGNALNEMLSDSSVESVSIDIPSVMTDMLVLQGNSAVSGTGHDPSDPLVYRATITNTAAAAEGTYPGLIKVKDTYTPGQNIAPLLAGMDGIQRVNPTQNPLEGLFPITEFATYQVFNIYVMQGNELPVAVLNTNPDPAQITEYSSVDFDGTASSDADGSITLYEFDFDWDGVQANFNADVSNVTGIGGSYRYDTAGNYTAGLRVTDDQGAYGWDSVTVEVQLGCVIHVDDDNASGPWDGSPAHPFIHVKDAVDVATDNCLIYIHPGTYTEVATGTYQASEITISNITNLRIEGEGMPVVRMARSWCLQTGKAAFHAYSCNGLTIKGLEITPYYAYQSGVWLENSSGCTVENVKVTESPEYGFIEFFRGSNCPDLVLRNNTLDGFGIVSTYFSQFVLSGCNNALITENKCRDMETNAGGNMSQTAEGFIAAYGSSNMEISKNIFGEHHRSFGSSGYVQLYVIYVSGGSNNVIRNNLIYDASFYDDAQTQTNNTAIYVASSSNLQVYNNTIDSFGISNIGTGLVCGMYFGGCTATTVHSNIFSNIMATTLGTCYGFFSDQSSTQSYSDVWNIAGGSPFRYAASAFEGSGGIDLDPMFTNPSGADYTLLSGSPCKGTGMSGTDMGCYGGSDPLP